MKTFFSKYCSAALPVCFAGKLSLCLFAMTVGGKNRLFGFTLHEGNAWQNFGKSTNMRTVSKDMIHLKRSQKFTFQITGFFMCSFLLSSIKGMSFLFLFLPLWLCLCFLLTVNTGFRYQTQCLLLLSINTVAHNSTDFNIIEAN